MRISLLYASVGGGHQKAAEAIGEAINIKYPDAKVDIIDGIDYTSKTVNKIIVQSYKTMATSIPALWEKFYSAAGKPQDGSLTYISNYLHKVFTLRLKKLFRQTKPDVIVSTHPSLTKMAGYLKKKGKTDAKIVVVLTDYESNNVWLKDDEWVDKYIVASENMKKDMIDFGIPSDKIETYGIPVSPKFYDAYDKQELYNMGLDPSKKTILFFCGGGLGLGKLTDYLRELVVMPYEFQVIAIAGKNEKNQKTLQDIADNSSKLVKVLGYTNEVPKLMNISDIVISKPGGLTVSECLACAKPIVIVDPIPGQEDDNANYFLNNGLAIKLNEDHKLERAVYFLFKDDFRLNQIIEAGKHIRNTNVSFDAADLCYNLYQEKLKDEEDINVIDNNR